MSLTPGASVTLTIEDIAFGGEGVARVNDFVVFVPFVLVGETVQAEVTEVKKSFARARLVKIVSASSERIPPECAHFGACGGCQYQHVAYLEQLRRKQKQISDLFQRIAGVETEIISPLIASPQPYGYRNRIMVRSQWNKPKQRLNIGFLRWDCGLVEDVMECKIAEPALNQRLQHVRLHPPPRGGIKVVLRIPPEGWDVPPDSFFQNNFFMLPTLLQSVGEVLTEAGTRHLVDLYCGVGFFGIELAGCVTSFVGVEYDAQAIKAARRNAESHGCTNGAFISGKVEEVLPDLVRKLSARETTVLMDPPRKGCRPEVLQLLRQVRPAQLIYVSCHPATMARDLNVLCANGVFELKRVQPLDMFPQTQHVECIADLRGTPQ